MLQGYIEQAHAERKEEDENALADLRRAPPCLSEAGLDAARGRMSEQDAIKGLQSYLNELGMRFPERTLNAFHTCLKINSLSPLTVLAGISGTGKSELPRRYAEGMGIHFFQMAVQPRWDSPQDLFGFYNYLEHRYIGTDLARALIHLDDFNHSDLAMPWRDRLLLVLLDEMNLARVEYYFSEFLSRLEVRKSVVANNPASRQNAEIHLDVGGRDRTFSIYVDRNVMFVGTMNEDESTQTLSDKVIDRANVLRFGRPGTMADEHPRQDVPRPDRYLSREVWASWQRRPDTLDQQSRKKLRDWIGQLNDAMDALERPFGHRVNQAIQLYCANYPAATPHSLADAFSDQLEQRILPKLRGIDTLEFSTPLGQIEDLIAKIGDDPLAEAVHSGRQKPLFGWQGLNRDI
jgi:MoxR-like ATPase